MKRYKINNIDNQTSFVKLLKGSRKFFIIDNDTITHDFKSDIYSLSDRWTSKLKKEFKNKEFILEKDILKVNAVPSLDGILKSIKEAIEALEYGQGVNTHDRYKAHIALVKTLNYLQNGVENFNKQPEYDCDDHPACANICDEHFCAVRQG